MTQNLAIHIQNLNYFFKKTQILYNLDLQVPLKSIYGFLGPNGAGKTTTIKIVLGLLKTEREKVYIFNQELNKHRLEILNSIGALVEMPALYEHLSGFDNLFITATLLGISAKRIGEVLTIVGLTKSSKKIVKEYSLGMKQRLGIAIALLNDPQLLILDEPTNGLDPEGIIEIRELITTLYKDHQKTIFISSHLLTEVEKICTDIGIIEKGKLLFQGDINILKKLSIKKVEISTNMPQKAFEIISHLYAATRSSLNIEKKHIEFMYEDDQEINSIIRKLVEKNIDIYYVKPFQPDLEELFLNIIKQKNHEK